MGLYGSPDLTTQGDFYNQRKDEKTVFDGNSIKYKVNIDFELQYALQWVIKKGTIKKRQLVFRIALQFLYCFVFIMVVENIINAAILGFVFIAAFIFLVPFWFLTKKIYMFSLKKSLYKQLIATNTDKEVVFNDSSFTILNNQTGIYTTVRFDSIRNIVVSDNVIAVELEANYALFPIWLIKNPKMQELISNVS